MLTLVLPHTPAAGDNPTTPWYGEVSVAILVGVVAWLYVRGRGRAPRAWRRRGADLAFVGGCLATISALASPLDAASAELASAHMIQHVALMLVAAPLFAWSAPAAAITRGVPRGVLVPVVFAARWIRSLRRRLGQLAAPTLVTTVYVAILWAWHVPLLYDAALSNRGLHAVEHASFFSAAVLFWSVVVLPRHRSPTPGARILLLFGVAMQSVFLAVILTFARTPWYGRYTLTTAAWGLDPLEDQQLAGAIMWVPAGSVYVATALGLVAAWLGDIEERGHRFRGTESS